ncbi:MAG: hypothetical protein IKB16_05305 [Lentisphaeria bacterium]|nr:hypothetical protein [Lentisphaeria bacterium]
MIHQNLILPLQNGAPIVLQGGMTGTSADFSGLCRLLNLEESPSSVSAESPEMELLLVDTLPVLSAEEYFLFRRNRIAAVYDRKNCSFRLYLGDDRIKETVPQLAKVWQHSIVYGVLAAMLRGKAVTLVHCSLLETARGGLMICGESGMGKSTTGRRIREAGGLCYADDLVLLEMTGPDSFTAYPLPTWSACQTSLTDKVYPYDRGMRLGGVLALSRGVEREEIRTVLPTEYFAQLYRSVYYFHIYFVRMLQREEQEKITACVQKITTALTSAFPALGLFANLSADIKTTLKEYL